MLTYEAFLAVENSNGCTDNHKEFLDVYPMVNTSITQTQVSCWPFNTQFNAPEVQGYRYSWDFGDGDTSHGAAPIHTYSNTTTDNISHNIQMIR